MKFIQRYIISGAPIPLKRPRFGKNGAIYDSQKNERHSISWELLAQRTHDVITTPVSLHIWFYMPIAHSRSKNKQSEQCHRHHTTRPDLSNLVKFIEDAANSVIFQDDEQIVDICCHKQYAMEPKTILHVYTLCSAKLRKAEIAQVGASP